EWEPLERLGSAFESTPHTIDVRQVEHGAGRYNIPQVGIFLWRLSGWRLHDSLAARVDDRRFLFNPLGANLQLFPPPQTEKSITDLAEPINVPAPISRRVLNASLGNYYGPDLSLAIAGVPIEQVAICNLSDASATTWTHVPPNAFIAIDPVLGRIA